MFGEKVGNKSPVTIKEKTGFSIRIKSIVFSSQGFPIVLMATVLAVLFVLFRMKGVELDYNFTEVRKKIDHSKIVEKSLKAKRARMLSVKKLRDLAKKHNYNQPRENQVIVIP